MPALHVNLLTAETRGAEIHDRHDRRTFLATALGAAAVARIAAQAPAAQPQVSPVPTPRDWSRLEPMPYPDPDIVALDAGFRRYIVFNTVIKRLHIGHALGRRAGVERRRPLSGVERHPEQRPDALDRRRRPRHDVPQSVGLQQRQHVRLRRPAALLRARRPPRRPLRANGTVTVIAEQVSGQAAELAERRRRASGRRHLVHRSDLRHPRQLRRLQGRVRRRRKPSIAWIRKTGQIDKVTDEVGQPNGLCFSPDYKKLYVADTGMPRDIKVWDVDGKTLRNGKRFVAARHSRDRRAVGRRRHPLRRRRQHLGGRAAGRAGDRADRRAHRHDPPAGDLRQRLLRRDAAQSAVHDREPVALRGLRRDDGRAHRLGRSNDRPTPRYAGISILGRSCRADPRADPARARTRACSAASR